MTEAARLVDELTPLLFTPFGTYRGRPQVACGACAKQADKPESVVHESDCPVYRLIRAEEANTAVIRANADEIADLEDVRDALEAQVNALTAEIERERQAFADLTTTSTHRIDALTTSLSELRSLLRDRSPLFQDYEDMKAERDELRALVIADQGVLVDAPALAAKERARAERAESERDVYRDALTLIARGVWTARNSVESIVWGAREALKKGAALAAASEAE